MASENGTELLPEHTNLGEDSAPQDNSSDGEREEKTTREKLQKTTIAKSEDVQSGEANASDPMSETHTETGLRGRPSKKRSFEDLQAEDSPAGIENGGPPLPKKGLHKRMRSREVSGNDEVHGLDKLSDVASPVQEESDDEAQKSPGGPGVLVSSRSTDENQPAATDKPVTSDVTLGESSITGQQSTSHIPASSGFANASTASPFSSFKSPKSPSEASEPKAAAETSTSTSAFASSGLSAFASSQKSPFESVSSTAKASGGFGGVGGGSGFGAASSGFGGPSPFASKPSSGFGSSGGFGSAGAFGGSFGAPKPFGTGVSSFAGSASTAGTFGKSKPFGSTNEDEEEGSENEGVGDEAQASAVDAPQDPRFKEQEIATGEEEEETIFTCRAKLYHFEKEWKERGAGVFKINIRYESKTIDGTPEKEKTEAEEDVEAGDQAEFSAVERKARLLMRTDGVHRLVLNTPVFKDMNVGTHDGQEPSGRTMHLTGLEEGKPTGFQIKVGKEDVLKEIYHKIQELKDDL
ncbi:hypothetical protein LTR20_008641 [Exophiala xenobiotica]|nr:hypothetical protein LTS13_002411 [Exophiala xenobiotica]KAK5399462.1 hypothetical protein LTR79_003099 [Exophiala xenobiotica]KAK5416451.1 hypothetical protein LTR90_005672 [Exophiala xenobiotica]KAK5457894.1 hypothetical protein LTR20_008641 [Exophiala xenobiotica]KAK5490865.1 hypothetical protein LTR26_003626 [Exophiala xenobiotica]